MEGSSREIVILGFCVLYSLMGVAAVVPSANNNLICIYNEHGNIFVNVIQQKKMKAH